jgi:hypothetical protein
MIRFAVIATTTTLRLKDRSGVGVEVQKVKALTF